MNEWTNVFGDGVSLSMWTLLGTQRVLLTKDSEGKIKRVTLRGKGKAVPLQAWIGPEGSEAVKFPRFRDNGTGWW